MNLKERLYFLPVTFLRVMKAHGVKDGMRFISDYNVIRKEIKKKLAATAEKFKIDNPGVAYQKYLDVDLWAYESLRRVYMLGLHKEGKKKAILDLGTGAGYFPYICNFYGHQAEALDVPDNEMYNQVIKNLGIKRYGQYIHPFQDIKVDNKYDLITGFMICFNNHKTPQVWHIKEWEYFLKNISNRNLNPKGKVFLSFNPETDEEPVSKELLGYFEKHKGKVKIAEAWLERESFAN